MPALLAPLAAAALLTLPSTGYVPQLTGEPITPDPAIAAGFALAPYYAAPHGQTMCQGINASKMTVVFVEGTDQLGYKPQGWGANCNTWFDQDAMPPTHRPNGRVIRGARAWRCTLAMHEWEHAMLGVGHIDAPTPEDPYGTMVASIPQPNPACVQWATPLDDADNAPYEAAWEREVAAQEARDAKQRREELEERRAAKRAKQARIACREDRKRCVRRNPRLARALFGRLR